MKLFAKRDRNYGSTTLGFCTTIIHRRTLPIPRDFFVKNWTHVAPQPPNSPDLAPCNFWQFPKLKRPLQGKRFDSIEEIERETVRALKTGGIVNNNIIIFLGSDYVKIQISYFTRIMCILDT